MELTENDLRWINGGPFIITNKFDEEWKRMLDNWIVEITPEEYEQLSDDDKKLYYQNVDINTQTKEQKRSYGLWSDRIKSQDEMLKLKGL